MLPITIQLRQSGEYLNNFGNKFVAEIGSVFPITFQLRQLANISETLARNFVLK